MFCMSCGAEAALGAPACDVCGARIGGSIGSQAERHQPERIPVSEALTTTTATSVPFQPSVGYGDLETLGLPREPAGRVLLGGLCLLVLTLVLPWARIAGVDVSPLRLGVPTLLLLAIVGAALLTVLRPSLSRHAVLAHAPVAAGAFFVGMGLCVWAIAGLFSASGSHLAMWVSSAPLLGSGGALPDRGPQPLFTPGPGMYVALGAGCIVLLAATAGRALPPVVSAGTLAPVETHTPSFDDADEREAPDATGSGSERNSARHSVAPAVTIREHDPALAPAPRPSTERKAQASTTPLERGELPHHRLPQPRVR